MIFCTLFVVFLVNLSIADKYPIPYQPVSQRPLNDPFCQAGLVPFCPTGKTTDSMPIVDDTDTIEVFAMKKPVWSFKYGPLLGYFHVMHDAIGMRSMKTGMNWTLEWYELDQLFNCTFPHFMDNGTLIWCNQGALCVYDGINDSTWTQYGFIEKVSEISGSLFNSFAQWSSNDNSTNVFYETWTIYNSKEEKNQIMYFDSFDCASWVLRAFDEMYNLGAKFNPKVNLNYTRLNLYSQEPVLLGSYEQIVSSGNQSLINDLRHFYKDFQKPEISDLLEQFIDIFTYIGVYKRFYFFYNNAYWLLNLKAPYIGITYDEIKLPGV